MIIDVAIVEDDTILRERYVELVTSAPDMRLLWTASTVAAALHAIDQCRQSDPSGPAVLLVDLGLPDGSGLDVIGYVKRFFPLCEAMVVSIFGDEENVVAAIEAGAGGYLLKDTLAEPFLDTIRELKAGGSPIGPSIARILLNRTRSPARKRASNELNNIGLAERELQILSLVAKGYNFPEIGRLLGISPNTVKTHIYRVYQKLSVHSRGEAVFEAKKLGLLDF